MEHVPTAGRDLNLHLLLIRHNLGINEEEEEERVKKDRRRNMKKSYLQERVWTGIVACVCACAFCNCCEGCRQLRSSDANVCYLFWGKSIDLTKLNSHPGPHSLGPHPPRNASGTWLEFNVGLSVSLSTSINFMRTSNR